MLRNTWFLQISLFAASFTLASSQAQGTSGANHSSHSCTPIDHGRNHGNGPFVVGGLCPDATGNSVEYVSVGRKFVMQLTGTNNSNGAGSGFGSSVSGFEVFDSHPGVNPGNITPSATTRAPAGTYTFTVTGLPAGNNYVYVTTLDTSGINWHDGFYQYPVSNGTPVSVVVPTVSNAGTPITVANFWIFADGSTPTGTFTVSNFMFNNKPLAIDTTHTDGIINFTPYDWCQGH
jgi:hypothetical protein